MLQKEDLQIIRGNRFQVPIYPSLLHAEVLFDTTIASRMFPIAAKEWHSDLTTYVQTLPGNNSEEKERKRWLQESYLDKKLDVIKDEYGRQLVRFWEDLVHCDNRGFVRVFSISRNAGGSLYLSDIFEREQFVMNTLIKFNEEKRKLYSINPNEGSTKMIMYSMHNVEYYPGALFLRNWAILYLNEALREVERQGKLL